MRSEEIAPLGDTLHRIATTVNSSLELKQILQQLGNISLEAIPADRCHLFLLDESGSKLIPTFSVGRVTDLRLWARFKNMEPIDLKAVPERWQLFVARRAFGIPDMSNSPLIPKEIVQVFRSRSALVVPLHAAGEPLGVWAFDWTEVGREFDLEEVELAEAIGTYAALAIRNSRLYERLSRKARTLERLVGVAGALNTKLSLGAVLELICEAFEEILGTSHCSVNTLDQTAPGSIRTLAFRGESWFTSRPESVAAVSPKEIARVNRGWQKSPQPVVYPSWEEQDAVDRSLIPAIVRSAALFPLVSSGKLEGFVLAGFPEKGGPASEALESGQALAEQAATAIGRAQAHRSLELQLERSEVVALASSISAGTDNLRVAVRKFNRVLKGSGIAIDHIAIANSKVRMQVGGEIPDHDEMAAIRSWRASLARSKRPLSPKHIDDSALIPIVQRNQVKGVLRARSENGFATGEVDTLSFVASRCAGIFHQSILRRHLVDNETRLAIAAERNRMARDLHDSVGQILTGMSLRLRTYLQDPSNQLWKRRLSELLELATRGRKEVREAINSLLFLEVRKKGLAKSLREMAGKFEATSGIDATFKVEGTPELIPLRHEHALFRVAHEALMNAERHSKATFVSMVLSYGKGEARLSVRDDGVGLIHRQTVQIRDSHFGLRAIEQLMHEAGGELEVRNANPRGVVVEGRIRRGRSKA